MGDHVASLSKLSPVPVVTVYLSIYGASLYGMSLLSLACRFLHPPHGLMPMAFVAFAMVSPRPAEGSLTSTR